MRSSISKSTLLASIALAAASTNAQAAGGLLDGLSGGCTGSLSGLIATDLSTCLSLVSFLGIFGGIGGNDSVVEPLNEYLSKNICPNAPCSASTLSSASKTIQSGCSSELQASQFNGAQAISFLVSHYDQARTAGCLSNTKKNNDLCLTETLDEVQDKTDTTLSLNALMGLISNSSAAAPLLQGLASDKDGICTDCTHALTTVIFPNVTSSPIGQGVVGLCGTGFADGKIPSDIKNGTSSTSSTNSTSGSGSGSGSGDGARALSMAGAVASSIAVAALAGVALL